MIIKCFTKEILISFAIVDPVKLFYKEDISLIASRLCGNKLKEQIGIANLWEEI